MHELQPQASLRPHKQGEQHERPTGINTRLWQRSCGAVGRSLHAHEHYVPYLKPLLVEAMVWPLRVPEDLCAVAYGACTALASHNMGDEGDVT
jgi:hypothetical protein